MCHHINVVKKVSKWATIVSIKVIEWTTWPLENSVKIIAWTIWPLEKLNQKLTRLKSWLKNKLK